MRSSSELDGESGRSSTSLKEKKKQQGKVNWGNFLVGTCLSFATQPFEVLRTSSIIGSQGGVSGGGSGLTFGELWKQVRGLYSQEGVRGFYRGGFIAIAKSTIGCGVFFTGLENVKEIFEADSIENAYLRMLGNFFTAATAKLGTTLVLSPFNVMKTRFEVVGQTEYTSVWKAMRKITMEEGFRGFYRGILPTLMRDIPWSGLQFAIYSSINQMYEAVYHTPATQSTSCVFINGAVSSGLALIIVYPMDNLRVRYQGKKLETRPMREMIQHIHAEQGVLGFFRGYLPRLLKKCTSGALTWTLYEKINARNNAKKLH